MDTSDLVSTVVGVVGLVVGGFGAVLSVMAYRVSRRATVASESSAKSSETSAEASVRSADTAREATNLQREAWRKQRSAEVVLNWRHPEGMIRYVGGTHPKTSRFELDIANRGQHPAYDVMIAFIQTERNRTIVSEALPEPLEGSQWRTLLFPLPADDEFLLPPANEGRVEVTFKDGRYDHDLTWPFRIKGIWPNIEVIPRTHIAHHEVWDDSDDRPTMRPIWEVERAEGGA